MRFTCDDPVKLKPKGRGPALAVKTIAPTRTRICKGCGIVQEVYRQSKSEQCLDCRDRGRRQNLSGRVFDQITVLDLAGKTQWGPEWNCQCSCGKLFKALAGNLTSGNTRTCGCSNTAENMVGQEHGLLTVMEWHSLTKSRAHLWICSCLCGGVVLVQTGNLKSSNTKSCGCLTGMKFPRVLTGLTFGWLTVVSPADTRKNGINWNCKCKCGAMPVVYGGDLRLWKKISCGCARTGKHEPIRPANIRTAERYAKMPRRDNYVPGERVTWAEVKALYEKQRGKCAEPTCNIKLNWTFHRDHIMPVKRRGPNLIKNIQLLCPSCNHRKGSMHPIDWANRNNRLC